MDGLKCTYPGCKKIIHAMTGLQELQKLQAHVRKAHDLNWDMRTALENRVLMENNRED